MSEWPARLTTPPDSLVRSELQFVQQVLHKFPSDHNPALLDKLPKKKMVTEYKLIESLQSELTTDLPSIEQIEQELMGGNLYADQAPEAQGW